MKTQILTAEEEKFACLLTEGKLTPLEAYLEAYPNPSTKVPDKLKSRARTLQKSSRVMTRVKELRAAAARASIMTGAKVIDEWTKIALADVNDLVQYQRVNCRHCHGTEGHYQWKDEAELADAISVAIDEKKRVMPHDKGGYGFRFNGKINNHCLNCFGEGTARLFYPDTRTLPDDAKRLYAGVKQTSAGIEIKTRDQDAALVNLAKYFKVLGNDEKSDTTVTINVKGGLPE